MHTFLDIQPSNATVYILNNRFKQTVQKDIYCRVGSQIDIIQPTECIEYSQSHIIYMSQIDRQIDRDIDRDIKIDREREREILNKIEVDKYLFEKLNKQIMLGRFR